VPRPEARMTAVGMVYNPVPEDPPPGMPAAGT